MKRLLILFLILFTAICSGVYTFSPDDPISLGSFGLNKPTVLGMVEIPLIKKNKIRFVGDIMLARNVENLMNAYGYAYPFSLLNKHPEDAYLVGNFEAAIPVVHKPTPNMQFSFSVNPKYLNGLAEYGFTHVSLANNHSYDFGADDFENTITQLKQASTSPFGHPKDVTAGDIPLLSVGAETVAIIGLYALDVAPSAAELQRLIHKASEVSSVQIVYVHWGTEYLLKHNKTQENLAHMMIDAGAEAVIGHHPHVVQDIEKYKGGVIFYSLGNFIFDQYFSEDVQRGLALELQVTDTTLAFTLLPVSSLGTRSTPAFMTAYEHAIFLDELAKNSDTELKDMIENGVVVIEL